MAQSSGQEFDYDAMQDPGDELSYLLPRPETFSEKMVRKTKENPFVLIGMLRSRWEGYISHRLLRSCDKKIKYDTFLKMINYYPANCPVCCLCCMDNFFDIYGYLHQLVFILCFTFGD